MNYFRILGHLETFDVVARLHKEIPNFDQDGLLLLRKLDGTKAPLFEKWASLNRLLTKARTIIRRQVVLGEDTGEIFIDRIQSGTATPWERDASSDYATFILPLVTNPFMFNYALGESVHMPVGSLWQVQTTVINSLVNAGEAPVYRLVAQIENERKA